MFYQGFRSIYIYRYRLRFQPHCIANDFKSVYVFIRFGYALDSNYTKVLYTIYLMEMICICIYDVFENHICIKGFFNGFHKDEFEDARSKIHPFLLRTVCELNVQL